MKKTRFIAILLILCGLGIGYFDFASESRHFAVLDKMSIKPVPSLQSFALKLGLDLQGGTHLEYKADVSKLASTTTQSISGVSDSMNALRDVIERRVNMFGVTEALVQVEHSGMLSDKSAQERLIVELPGMTDIDQAVKMIGATPVLEFKTERAQAESDAIVKAQDEYKKALEASKTNGTPAPEITPLLMQDPYFVPTELTGRYLKRATMNFSNTVGTPGVSLEFNSEGQALFAKITKENVGKRVAIYLDGSPITTPVVREEISSGNAEITGNFTTAEAKQLVGRLNSGALPVPIELLSAQTVGATLGGEAYAAVVHAGLLGFLIVALFMVLWYRLPGLLAIVSLSIYAGIMIALFKIVPVTMTAAGIAAFILSIGMAVDANILIFARMNEELRKGRTIHDAILEGFARAWTSIRDSNSASIISAIILFWFGTSMIKGFALVLGLGVMVSMFTALTVTRTILLALGVQSERKCVKFLFGSGFGG